MKNIWNEGGISPDVATSNVRSWTPTSNAKDFVDVVIESVIFLQWGPHDLGRR